MCQYVDLSKILISERNKSEIVTLLDLFTNSPIDKLILLGLLSILNFETILSSSIIVRIGYAYSTTIFSFISIIDLIDYYFTTI